jgi:nucleoside-triphosphatase THEP1
MVTGLPGCGKTMVVNRILDDFDGLIRSIRLNAMTFNGIN